MPILYRRECPILYRRECPILYRRIRNFNLPHYTENKWSRSSWVVVGWCDVSILCRREVPSAAEAVLPPLQEGLTILYKTAEHQK